MAKPYEIGEEARNLDKLSIKERMKLERSSLKKMLFASLVYLVIMFILSIIL